MILGPKLSRKKERDSLLFVKVLSRDYQQTEGVTNWICNHIC